MGLSDTYVVGKHLRHTSARRGHACEMWCGAIFSLVACVAPCLSAGQPLPTRQELCDAIAAGAKQYETITLEYEIDERLWNEDTHSVVHHAFEIKFERSKERFRFQRRYFEIDSVTKSRELKANNFGVFDGKNSYEVHLPAGKNDVPYALALIAPGENSTIITKQGPYNLVSFLWGNGPDIALADSFRDPHNDVSIIAEAQEVAGCRTVHATLTMRDASGAAYGRDDYWFALDHGCVQVKRTVTAATGEVIYSWVAAGVDRTRESVWFPTSIRMTYPKYDPDVVFKLMTVNSASTAPISPERFQDVIPRPASVNNTVDGTWYFLPSVSVVGGGQPQGSPPFLSRSSWAGIGFLGTAAVGLVLWRRLRS